MAARDPFDDVSSSGSIHDSFEDDGEYASDADYQPSGEISSSSEDEAQTSRIRHKRHSTAAVSSSKSTSSSSSDADDSDKLSREVSQSTDIAVSQEHAPLVPDVLVNNEEHSIVQCTSGQLNPTNTTPGILPSGIPDANGSWSHTIAEIPQFNFDSSRCGITVNTDDINGVLDFFHLVFPQNFIEFLVNCTNSYGNALCNTNRPHTRHSRKMVFREVTSEEIIKFFGLSLLKGHIKSPKQRNFFSLSDPLYYHPIFSFIMSGRRYEQILRCLNASDLEAKGENKIVKFIDMMTLNFRKIYNAGRELSLDESLLLFRGRLHFRQYIKSKKARYGIKFYELTTSDGYVLNIKMYSGREVTDQNMDEIRSKTEKLVLRLMRPYLLNGHHLFMANYYNSVNIAQKLIELKTHCTGTLRANRKENPVHIAKKKLKRSEHVWARKNKVYVSKWKDKCPVMMITTSQHPSIVEVRNRFGKTRLKPAEVELYNKYMSGIDRSDQMISYYSCPRKTIRWYKKVLFHLLDIAVWNAYFLFKKNKKNNASTYHYINYRDELIKVMIGINDLNIKGKDIINQGSINDNRRFRPSTSFACPSVKVSVTENTKTGHWPEQMLSRPGTAKKFAFLKCKVCTKNNVRKETSYRCKGCPEKPPLCPSCFEPYHNSLSQNE